MVVNAANRYGECQTGNDIPEGFEQANTIGQIVASHLHICYNVSITIK